VPIPASESLEDKEGNEIIFSTSSYVCRRGFYFALKPTKPIGVVGYNLVE
jgi:hypothetical protein